MQYSEFTPHTMRSGTDAARFLLRAGPAPLGVSDVVHGVLDPHRTAVAPSPEWHRLARRFGSTISTLVGRAAQAMHVGAPRRA